MKKKLNLESRGIFSFSRWFFYIITKFASGNSVCSLIKKGGCIRMAPRGAREGPVYFGKRVQRLPVSKNIFMSCC